MPVLLTTYYALPLATRYLLFTTGTVLEAYSYLLLTTYYVLQDRKVQLARVHLAAKSKVKLLLVSRKSSTVSHES